MTVANLNKIYIHRQLFWRVTIGAGCLLLAYLYLVNSVVFNIVARQKALESLASKQNQVASLEAEYLSLSNAVTLELAHNLGFRDASGHTIFAPLVTPVVAVNSSATL